MFSGNLQLTDDNDFFLDVENSRTRANLSSVFGIVGNNIPNENPSLKYTLEKPMATTKKNTELDQNQKQSDWSIEAAKVVTAFKLINNENISQGKLGLTVLKNATGLQRIILYRTKTDILSTTILSEDVKLYVKNSYLQFKDDLKVYWSVLFDKHDEFKMVLSLIEDKVINYDVPQSSTNDIQSPIVDDFKESIPEEPRKDKVSNNKDRKSKLLSRMAKLGQSLPPIASKVATTTTTEPSDSSTDDGDLMRNKSTSSVVPLRRPKSNPQLLTFAQSQQTISPMINTINTMASYSTGLLSNATDPNIINMLMSENRTQNTELRMNLTKLEMKIEKVLDKFDNIQLNGAESRSTRGEYCSNLQHDDVIIDLEEKLLNYKKENRKIKQQFEELENKYTELLQSRESKTTTTNIDPNNFKEFNNLLELLQMKVEDFDTLDEIYKTIIQKLKNQNTILENTLDKDNAKVDEYKNQITILEQQMKEEKLQHSEIDNKSKNEINNLHETIDKLTQHNSALKMDNEAINEKLKELTVKMNTIENDKHDALTQLKEAEKKSQKIIETTIKDIMNNMYQSFLDQFSQRGTFSSSEILQIIATTIKKETNDIIKKNRNN